MQEYQRPIQTLQLRELSGSFSSYGVREITIVVAKSSESQNKVGQVYDDEWEVEYVPYLRRWSQRGCVRWQKWACISYIDFRIKLCEKSTTHKRWEHTDPAMFIRDCILI